MLYQGSNGTELTGQSPLIRVRTALVNSATVPITLSYEGLDNAGERYTNLFRFADLEILLDFEDTTFTDSDMEVVLAKPRLLISSTIGTRIGLRHEADMTMEWLLMVNTANFGRLNLEGYSQLCQVICDFNQFGWYWHQYGLVPRNSRLSPVKDGGAIATELQSRVLLRSLFVNFSLIGELHDGAR